MPPVHGESGNSRRPTGSGAACIVDALRAADQPVHVNWILRELPPASDERRVRTLLSALSDEGLIRYDPTSSHAELEP